MWAPSWISYSTLTKHHAGTSIWYQCSQLGPAETLSSVKHHTHLPAATWRWTVLRLGSKSLIPRWTGRISYSIWFAHFLSFSPVPLSLHGFYLWSLLSTLFANPAGCFILLVIFPNYHCLHALPVCPSFLLLVHNGASGTPREKNRID